MASSGSGSTDAQGNNLWALLPSFDPAVDDIREYVEKVKFLQGICPKNQRGMLAPRLAMLCKGTAWGQVKRIDPAKLTDGDQGVANLLAALASWEETAEMKTYEQFEKAMYRITQKGDESTASYVNRMEVAFHDVGDSTTLGEVRAFVLLRQSALGNEDKKRILTMVNGNLSVKEVENAMRSLSTKILTSSSTPEAKKKVYPANYMENETVEEVEQEAFVMQGQIGEEEELDGDYIEMMASQGDGDAVTVASFEKDLEEMFQEVPDLQSALVSYVEARSKLVEKRRHRGFWPVKGQSKGKGFGKKKGGPMSGKSSLLSRIARTHCKLCGEKGHWKAECPRAQASSNPGAREQANVAQSSSASFQPHVIEEDLPPGLFHEDEAGKSERCEVLMSVPIQQVVVRTERMNDPEFCEGRLSWSSNHVSLSSSSIQAFVAEHRDNSQSDRNRDSGDNLEKIYTCRDNQTYLKEAQKFLQHRMAARKSPTSESSTQEVEHSPSSEQVSHQVFLCQTNQMGQAILDTGASRSVIGRDLVPGVLKQLPRKIRQQVRERPSRVGFRFGNNQISYRDSQIQIPIYTQSKRYWILIEVVPKATPFLISIKTMKSLGAQLDLQENTCYLKELKRSLPLHENKNGLYMISIQDLCCAPQFDEPNQNLTMEICAAAPEVQVPSFQTKDRDWSDRHANSFRDASSNQGGGRGGDGIPSHVTGDFDALSRDSFDRRSQLGRYGSHQPTGERSTVPKATYRGTGSHVATAPTKFYGKFVCWWKRRKRRKVFTFPNISRTDRRGRMGTGIGRASNRGFSTRRKDNKPESSCCISSESNTQESTKEESNYNGYDVSIGKSAKHETSPNDSGKSFRHASWKHWRPCQWSPRGEQSTDHAGQLDHRSLGTKESLVGTQTPTSQVCRRVRDGSGLLGVVESPSKDSYTRNDGFHFLLPHKGGDGSTSPGDSDPKVNRKGEPQVNWEPIIETGQEAMWVKEIGDWTPGTHQIDLLEVYASPNSRLVEAVRQIGGKAERFTFEHGDLSTEAGRKELLRTIDRLKPKHLWMAPECLPWCAWNRFNKYRSRQGFERVQDLQEESRKQLRFCSLLCKLQVHHGRHFHVENPDQSEMWQQEAIRFVVMHSRAVRFDQCRYGLRHTITKLLMKKNTRVQTTSQRVVEQMDGRFCDKRHDHSPIAGSFRTNTGSVHVSRFSAFYPVILARAVARAIIGEHNKPVTCWEKACVGEDDQETNPKRRKMNEEKTEESTTRKREAEGADDTGAAKRSRSKPLDPPDDSRPMPVLNFPNPETDPFKTLQKVLPKSGAVEWNDPSHALVQQFQHVCPDLRIMQVRASKGVDKYMIGNEAFPIRHTLSQSRFDKEKVYDLGPERWTELSQNQKRRKAVPSHIMVCLFGHDPTEDLEIGESPRADEDNPKQGEDKTNPKASVSRGHEEVTREGLNQETSPPMHAAVPGWTPAAVSNHGPRFLSLTAEQKGLIGKLHKNLGHPTAERLAVHIAAMGVPAELVAGAKDYVCSSCAERCPPRLSMPGRLQDPKDFNEVVQMDGFYWSNKSGIKVHVLHAVDEATHFHLGKRTSRDEPSMEKALKEFWGSWAGMPHYLMFDTAGELVSQKWKDFLQRESIQPIVTATPQQRGRVERHGGIIKEMLSRMDSEQAITTVEQFDAALYQAFHAKNSMISHAGYSPEQAVLGKSSRLPGSITSDDLIGINGGDTETDQFQRALDLRTRARKAFLESDNSQAIRRAINRKSRGDHQLWNNGQLCMYWDKRKSPNMLEKGRWCGPAQVILQESRTIVWVNHINRLRRCSAENLRAVSLREFSDHRFHIQPIEPHRLEEMAKQLTQNLKEKSGMFQFSDLSEVSPPEQEVIEVEQSLDNQNGRQPEEEPQRRNSNLVEDTFKEALETPVPETPIPSPSDSEEDPLPVADAVPLETGDIGPQDVNESLMVETSGVIYDAYIMEAVEDGVDFLQGDEDTIWPEKDSQEAYEVCSFEFTLPKQHAQKCVRNLNVHEAYITSAAKKAKGEVTYTKLTTEEKHLFEGAKEKELKCWIETSTVRKILRNRVHPSRIMTSRWILTWKDDDKEPTGRRPKARLVVRGYQDPELDQVTTDSPTLSRDARMLLFQTVASQNWRLQNFDITTAFLRGRADGRELAMEPVPELKQLLRMSDSEICLLEGNAYGRVDAPLLFYKEFRKHLEAVGFEAHPLDNCLYLLRNKRDPSILDGILGTHVDDGVGGGNHHYDVALEKLQQHLPFGSREYDRFRFTGLDIEQLPDYSIRISQRNYIEKIDPIDIPKLRRNQKEEEATPGEIHALRGLCGSLQYAAVHSRPDIATKVSGLQKSVPQAKVSDLLEANKVLREAKDFGHTTIMVRPIPIGEITFASFGDASFASSTQLKAQQGLFVMACTEKLQQNQTSDFSPIAWNTKQIGRVVRSTLSAEAYAMSTSLDKLNWISCMWGYIVDPKFCWQKPEASLKTLRKALLITDCKSLFDLVTKLATPNCQEWRTTVEVMLIKQQAQDNAECRWVSTAIMLADCLTKNMDSQFLRKVLSLGRFRIYDEGQTLKENANKKYGTTWIEGSFKR